MMWIMALWASSRVRRPTVAGQFYEEDGQRCGEEARRLCRPYDDEEMPPTLCGAMVPHAGWVFSGRVAGGTLATLARHTEAKTFVLTGSVHTMDLARPATDSAEAWMTPLGEVPVDGPLREAINALDEFECRDAAHRHEHSLEVQLPLMQTALADVFAIVPCLIPVRQGAVPWGRALGELLRRWSKPVAMIASTDLTHYGPNYGFHPQGVGEEGRRWASEVNDRALLALAEEMAAERALEHAAKKRSACGGGAIAATIAACKEMGAARGYVLDHTDSAREGAAIGYRDKVNSVGYGGVVFG